LRPLSPNENRLPSPEKRSYHRTKYPFGGDVTTVSRIVAGKLAKRVGISKTRKTCARPYLWFGVGNGSAKAKSQALLSDKHTNTDASQMRREPAAKSLPLSVSWEYSRASLPPITEANPFCSIFPRSSAWEGERNNPGSSGVGQGGGCRELLPGGVVL